MLEKKIFGNTIKLEDIGIADPYDENISKMFRWMKALKLKKNATIFDVGANVGLFSLVYANMFIGSKIHSFEPVTQIFDILIRNLKLNPDLSSNINAYNIGASNRVEERQLSIPTHTQHDRYNDETDIRLYSVLGQGENKINAEFVPLDKWIIDFRVPSVDFIKIDVEGYEYPVLQGASNILRSHRPIVMFELNQLTLALSDIPAEEYLRFGKDHRYKIFGLQYGFKEELLAVDSPEQVILISDLVLIPK